MNEYPPKTVLDFLYFRTAQLDGHISKLLNNSVLHLLHTVGLVMAWVDSVICKCSHEVIFLVKVS